MAGAAHLVQHGKLATGLIDGGLHMLVCHTHRTLCKHKVISTLSRLPALRVLYSGALLRTPIAPLKHQPHWEE